MIINKTNLGALFTGYKALFQKAFDAAPSIREKIATTVPSSTREEIYGWLGMSTGFREWAGDRVIQSLEAHGYTIKNKNFENTIAIDRNDIEDDNYSIFGTLFGQLGMDAKTHPDILLGGLLKDGFQQTGYDGQYFFDTDHPVGGQSVSNMQAGAGDAWFLLDTSRVIKPLIFQVRKDYNFVKKDQEEDDNVFMRQEFVYGVDARVNAGYALWQLAYGSKSDLTAANYAAARKAMMNMRADNGRPLGIRPTLLIVPPSLEDAALAVVKAENDASGASNIYANSAELIVSPWVA